MASTFTANARRLGIWSAGGTAFLGVAYIVPLVGGFLSLKSPDDPIGDPWFSILEILIILMMPVMVAMMVAVHAWADPESKVFSLLAIVFMSIVAGLTCSLHFVILTLSHQPAFVEMESVSLLLSFRWPSVVYALDILAWDFFFPLSVLSAAIIMRGKGAAAAIRWMLVSSGLLAFGGLAGVFDGDMQLRNIGIVGYAVLFPIAALLLARLFRRTAPVGA
jgi:hypothetical protein